MSFVNLQMAEQLSITYIAADNPHLHVVFFTSNNQRIQKFHVHVPIKIIINKTRFIRSWPPEKVRFNQGTSKLKVSEKRQIVNKFRYSKLFIEYHKVQKITSDSYSVSIIPWCPNGNRPEKSVFVKKLLKYHIILTSQK